MEDYDKFVQHQLFQLRKGEEEANTSSPVSSVICFYGRAILPPLLSGDQREEMQRHRDAAKKAAVHLKRRDDPRMTYVQTIQQSVQLRKTPTLEEFLQDLEINTQPLYSCNATGGSVSKSIYFKGTTDLLTLPPPERKENDNVSLPLFTSTTYSAFFAPKVATQQEEYPKEPQYRQQESQPSSLAGESHLCSGYETCENVSNTICHSGRMDEDRERPGVSSSGDAYNMGGFFLHNTSDTIAKMPDIINYPPIDGEELERSGFESSFCNNYVVGKDTCCSFVQGDSVICEDLLGEKSECSQEESTEGGANVSSSTVVDLDKEHNEDTIKDQVSVSENSFSEHLEPHPSQKTELHIQPDPSEAGSADNHEDAEMPSEVHYRFNLQALLKKSQEYRQRQRMLRNQAKNSKVQERTQEQQRTMAEEPSLSDKENDEFPHKSSVMSEGKKNKKSKETFVPSSERSQNKCLDNHRRNEGKTLRGKKNFRTESTCLSGDENMKEIPNVEEEIDENNKLNISSEIFTEPKQMRAFTQQQLTSRQTSPVQVAFSLTTSTTSVHKGSGKYHSIPAPNFCRSPVQRKCKVSIQDGEAVDGAETLKLLADEGLNEDVNLGQHISHGGVPSTMKPMADINPEGISTRNSQHIDQLESNFSGLKVLISDLESTLTENFRNPRQTESKLTRSDDDYSTCQGVQGQNLQNMLEDTGPAVCVGDSDDVPVLEGGKETEEVNFGELRLVKTLVTERQNEKGLCKDRLIKSYGQHGCSRKQQPPAKCIHSVKQQLGIPNMFRNVSSEDTAPRNASMLSETSNHPVERRNEVAVEGHPSSCSASLNQSYDVDAPSCFCLPDVTEPDSDIRGHVEGTHLTPESEGEGQGGLSKAKRRLMMHMSEETQERRMDVCRGEGTVVRPNSSTPKAGVRWTEGHDAYKEKQEQLKVAHAAQIRAMQDEHRRQQEELLQALAMRFRLLQSVSFPCSMSDSCLGDALTFTSLSQPSSSLSERCRHLLLAAAKGFLTRRLLRTERVAQLVRTIRDTRQLLQAFQQQKSPGRGELGSRQDLLLQERLALQLRAARYEVSDIFFSLSSGERMQMISWDRELAWERELRRQSGHMGRPSGKSSLSAATQKSLQRKRERMIQKTAAGLPRRAVTRAGHNPGSSAEQLLETKRGQFRANPQRVPKSTYSSGPR